VAREGRKRDVKRRDSREAGKTDHHEYKTNKKIVGP
jgi:hypothetical protein